MEAQQNYLQLLFSTTPSQQKALLVTVTEDQVKALAEIAHNLPRLTDLGSHHRFIKYLGNSKHSLRYKKTLIKKHYKLLLEALLPLQQQLLQLIE